MRKRKMTAESIFLSCIFTGKNHKGIYSCRKPRECPAARAFWEESEHPRMLTSSQPLLPSSLHVSPRLLPSSVLFSVLQLSGPTWPRLISVSYGSWRVRSWPLSTDPLAGLISPVGTACSLPASPGCCSVRAWPDREECGTRACARARTHTHRIPTLTSVDTLFTCFLSGWGGFAVI